MKTTILKIALLGFAGLLSQAPIVASAQVASQLTYHNVRFCYPQINSVSPKISLTLTYQVPSHTGQKSDVEVPATIISVDNPLWVNLSASLGQYSSALPTTEILKRVTYDDLTIIQSANFIIDGVTPQKVNTKFPAKIITTKEGQKFLLISGQDAWGKGTTTALSTESCIF